MYVKTVHVLLHTYAVGGPHLRSDQDVQSIHTWADEVQRNRKLTFRGRWNAGLQARRRVVSSSRASRPGVNAGCKLACGARVVARLDARGL